MVLLYFQAMKAFQRLIILVRDWALYEEQPFGTTNLEFVSDDTSPEELRKINNDIIGSFEKINCFNMPEPGKLVKASRDFDGKLGMAVRQTRHDASDPSARKGGDFVCQ